MSVPAAPRRARRRSALVATALVAALGIVALGAGLAHLGIGDVRALAQRAERGDRDPGLVFEPATVAGNLAPGDSVRSTANISAAELAAVRRGSWLFGPAQAGSGGADLPLMVYAFSDPDGNGRREAGEKVLRRDAGTPLQRLAAQDHFALLSPLAAAVVRAGDAGGSRVTVVVTYPAPKDDPDTASDESDQNAEQGARSSQQLPAR